MIADSDGTLWVSDNRATAMRVGIDGRQSLFGPRIGTLNGLAMDRHGVLYVADIDSECVYRVFLDGRHETVTDQLPGAVNFVYLDDSDRLWTTVSTRTKLRSRAVEDPIPDSYVALHDSSGFRTVAQGSALPMKCGSTPL